MNGSWACVLWMWSMSLGRREGLALVQRHSSINWYYPMRICPDWPMRMLDLPRLTNERSVSWFKHFNWGIAASGGGWVGRDHSPINHSTSCLQIRLGRPLGTKLFHWFAHLFISAANFLKIDLQPFPARVGTLIPFQIDLDASPRQRFEKALEQAECRLVR